ncbi:hypothetical protein N665_0827s0024 [Sinapis alba]|nr:hypothetical protein N665_0827s0024 [Sinapis alba]
MSLAPTSYTSLYSSPSLPRPQKTKQSPSLITQPSFALETESTAKTEEKDDEEEEEKYETYEVEVEQPYGLKFRKGRDGGTYIDTILPGGFADKTRKFTVGDRVIATSAVFGTEIWPAAEYGRTMYTIRQRIGPLLMQMEKRYGKVDDSGELTEKEIIRAERNAGFISSRLREIQEALERFESVLGSKPTPDEASVASYSVACCYSKLN